MRRPDFFFVGHPRSGSGLLDSFLKGHPDLFMSRKELHYFGSDLRYHDPPRSLENYLAHFKGAKGEARVGEASTWYLASEKAAQEIRQFADDDVRILMLLRDPVTWLASLHSHLVFTGDEDIEDFEAALDAEPDRRQGRRLLPQAQQQRILNSQPSAHLLSQHLTHPDKLMDGTAELPSLSTPLNQYMRKTAQ